MTTQTTRHEAWLASVEAQHDSDRTEEQTVNEKKGRRFIQEIEVAGNQLTEKIKALMADADAKRVVIKDQKGRQLLAMPLTLGLAGGAIAALVAPMLTAIGVVGGYVAKLKLEVEREGEPRDSAECFAETQSDPFAPEPDFVDMNAPSDADDVAMGEQFTAADMGARFEQVDDFQAEDQPFGGGNQERQPSGDEHPEGPSMS